MTSVNNNVIGNDLDNVIDINNVNYDVFAVTFLWGNFSDPFYSAEMRSNNKRAAGISKYISFASALFKATIFVSLCYSAE